MDAERRKAKDEMKNLPFRKKWENFWFYYKIHVAVILCTVIVLGVSIAQCMNRIDYDLEVCMCTVFPVSESKVEAFSRILTDNIVDINDNDSVDADVVQLSGDITQESLDPMTQGVMTKLRTEIAAYTYPVYIVDEAYKDMLLESIEPAVNEMVDLSLSPVAIECFGLKEGEKLYWIELLDRDDLTGGSDKLTKFDNAARVTDYFNKNLEN